MRVQSEMKRIFLLENMKTRILIFLMILAVLPVSCKKEGYAKVETSAITKITGLTAVGGGNVTADGGSTVSAKGICWSTVSPPTVANSVTVDGEGLGTYTSYLSHLNSATKYYVRAYATNSFGTAYGQIVSFTTY